MATPHAAACDSGMRVVETGGSRFTYLEHGSGTPLVLLHGIGSAARSWIRQLALAPALRVIAWDAPGYGGSTPLYRLEPDAEDYAAALDRFLEALRVERFHLVGHSLGCVIAARFARLNTQRVLSLTLASIATGHARLALEERERLREARLRDLAELGPRGMAEKRAPRLLSPGADEASVRAVAEIMAQVQVQGYRQAVHMLSGADTRKDVRRLPLSMRVQFIYGDQDVVTTPGQNLSVARERPHAAVHVLKGAGHALYVEQPAEFNALLVHFIESESNVG
jgi:pimeloyl-ACP methyl ester carboxylesterase